MVAVPAKLVGAQPLRGMGRHMDDVIVVGAGPTGGMLANELALQGVTVTIFD